jgi:hypothetical protein
MFSSPEKLTPMYHFHKFLAIAIAFVLPFSASAHAGHSNFSADHILHYLATPDHAVPILSALIIVAAAGFAVRKRLAARSIRNSRK